MQCSTPSGIPGTATYERPEDLRQLFLVLNAFRHPRDGDQDVGLYMKLQDI